MTDQANTIEFVWDRIRAQLEGRKDSIYQQIKSYPTPIAGCDDQFNGLLEQQAQVAAELTRLNQKERESRKATDPSRVIDEFLLSSAHVEPQEKETIRTLIGRSTA